MRRLSTEVLNEEGHLVFNMFYVYVLQSTVKKDEIYTGYTKDLKNRLEKHNKGDVKHTSKYSPWIVSTYIAFDSQTSALDFEKYLKSGSGRVFLRKRLISLCGRVA